MPRQPTRNNARRRLVNRRPTANRRPPVNNNRRRRTTKLPLSGSEPLYSDLEYGTRQGKDNNNCYAYAIGSYRIDGGYKLQPGNLARRSTSENASSCKFLDGRTLEDNRARGIYRVAPDAKCNKGFYKIMSVIDKGRDYHWYVQNGSLLYRVLPGDTRKSIATKFGVPPRSVLAARAVIAPGDLVYVKGAGVWSHKRGLATGPLLVDSKGKVITDPRRAARDYGSLDYRTFCNAYCIRDVPGAMSSKPSPVEARALQALLHKNVGLLHARKKQAGQLPRRRPKVKPGNGRKAQLQNARA